MPDSFVAAVDLGTTTVEVSLVRKDGTVAARHGFLNPQKKYGSDVISRMTYLKKNPESDSLRSCVLQELNDTIKKMLSWQAGSKYAAAEKVIVTCNTVMGAIILGLPTSGLSEAPFVSPFTEPGASALEGKPMVVLPGTSAFLGSDSCGGAWGLGLKDGELLMDLGTNGEMIVNSGGKLYGTSAACGPAFENCVRARGIYGKTVISAISELLRKGKISGDGVLPPEVASSGIEAGGITVTADILRDVMLAKAALSASFTLLVRRAGLEVSELKHIYLAGGFGFYLSLRDAVTVGLIPEKLRERVNVSGNTSLMAAEKMAAEGYESYDAFRGDIVTMQFAGDPEYEELFYKSLNLCKC